MTQQCGVFIGKVGARSKKKVEDIKNEFNKYYQEYGHRGQQTNILVILTTQKSRLLTVRGWKLQKEDDAKELPEKTFEYDGKI